MGFLYSLLGALPASNSIARRLNGLDWKKTLRSTLLPAVGAYVLVAVLEKLLTDFAGWGLPPGVTTQIVVVLTPTLEILRRKYAAAFAPKQ